MSAILSASTVHVGRTLTGDPVEVPLHTAHRGHPVLITGGKGTGKSVLLRSIAAQLAQAGQEVAFHEQFFTASSLPEGVTGFWEASALLDYLEPVVAGRHLGDHSGPEVVLLDDVDHMLNDFPHSWARLLPRAFAAGIAVVAVTHTLHPAGFGHQKALRDRLLGGSVIRTWTASKWDHASESVVDLAALPRFGGAYVQTPADDTPFQVRLEEPLFF